MKIMPNFVMSIMLLYTI